MLETFTFATFASRLQEAFRLHPPDAASPLDLELIEATALGQGQADEAEIPGRRVPFSIVFRGPAVPVLPQRIYRLEHDAIGSFELFLVPIGPDRVGMRYEAIFT